MPWTCYANPIAFDAELAELMAEAGMSPEQILRSATGDAARCIGRDDIGVLEAWHALPGSRNVAYFGGRLAQSLNDTSPATLTYLTSTMGVA